MKGGEVVKALFKMGVMATINEVLDHDTAVLVVEELGHKAVRAEAKDAEMALSALVGSASGDTTQRPPVVTIMGLVDHGRSEEHTSELQSLMRISYAVFCLKKQNKNYYTEQNNVITHIHTANI